MEKSRQNRAFHHIRNVGGRECKTVSSYNNYSPTQFIYTLHTFLFRIWFFPSSFLVSLLNESIRIMKFVSINLWKNCHHSKDAQASICCRQALGKNLLTFPVRSTFLWMSVSTSRNHQHLTWELFPHSAVTHRYKFQLWNPS